MRKPWLIFNSVILPNTPSIFLVWIILAIIMTNTRPNTDIHLTWYNCKWNRLIHKGFYLVINSVFCGWGTGLIKTSIGCVEPLQFWFQSKKQLLKVVIAQRPHKLHGVFLDTHPFKRLIKYWGLMTPCWHWGFQATIVAERHQVCSQIPWRTSLVFTTTIMNAEQKKIQSR